MSLARNRSWNIPIIFFLSLFFCTHFYLSSAFAGDKPTGEGSSATTLEESIANQQQQGPKQVLTEEEQKQRAIEARERRPTGQQGPIFSPGAAHPKIPKRNPIDLRKEVASQTAILSSQVAEIQKQIDAYEANGYTSIDCPGLRALISQLEELHNQITQLEQQYYSQTGGVSGVTGPEGEKGQTEEEYGPPAPVPSEGPGSQPMTRSETYGRLYESEIEGEKEYRERLHYERYGQRQDFLRKKFVAGSMSLDEFMEYFMGAWDVDDYLRGKEKERSLSFEWGIEDWIQFFAMRGYYSPELTPDQFDEEEAKDIMDSVGGFDEFSKLIKEKRKAEGYPDPVDYNGEMTFQFLEEIKHCADNLNFSHYPEDERPCRRAMYIIKHAFDKIVESLDRANDETKGNILGNGSEDILNSGVAVCRHYAALFVAALRYAGIPAKVEPSTIPYSHVWARVKICGKEFDVDIMNYNIVFTPVPPRKVVTKPKAALKK